MKSIACVFFAGALAACTTQNNDAATHESRNSTRVRAQAALEPAIVRVNLPGRAIFEAKCAPCHGSDSGVDGSAMLPGTEKLAAKYRGQLPPQLELRSDLSTEMLRTFLRHGSGGMPMFRKGELTDEEINLIAAYIAATAKASTR